MANPVMRNTAAFQSGQSALAAPPPDPGMQVSGYAPIETDQAVMTYNGVLSKSIGFFILALSAAVLVAVTVPTIAPALGIGAFVMSLVVAFRKKAPSPVLYGVVLALWGGAAGGISALYEAAFNGIVLHALIATATVFAVSLAVYKSGRVRNMNKVRKFLMIAVPAYVAFSLIDFGMVMFGMDSVRDANLPGSSIPLGIILSAFAILVGAFMLISDFDFVDNGVAKRVPAIYEWTAAYGLVFAIIWIYVEMLRLLSYLRGR